MKQFRLLGMALLALIMSVGFVACSSSDDDDNNGGGSATSVKRITKIYSEEDGEKDDDPYIFVYDNAKKLKTFYNGDTYAFEWKSNEINVKTNNGKSYTFTVVDGLLRNGNIYNEKYSYSSNKLSALSTSIGTYHYKWDGDKLIECEGMTFSYSGKTCKGYNPIIFDTEAIYTKDWLVAYPELIGMRTTQLPDGFTIQSGEKYKLTYTFDKEGYVASYTVQKDQVTKGANSYYTWYFIWE